MSEKRRISISCSQEVRTRTGLKKFKVTYNKDHRDFSSPGETSQWALRFTSDQIDKYAEMFLPSVPDKIAFTLYFYNQLKELSFKCNKGIEELKHMIELWKEIKEKNFAEVLQLYKLAENIDEIYSSELKIIEQF